MSRFRSIPLTCLLSVSMAGCVADSGEPVASEDQVLLADDPASLVRAEQLAYDHLGNAERALLEGVDAVFTKSVKVDELGMSHTRLTQTHDLVPVFGGEAIVHTDRKGAFRFMTDSLVRDIDVDTTPRLSELEAIDLAVSEHGGWDSLSDPPVADLQILRHEKRDYLTYRVQLRQVSELHAIPAMPVVFIDAHTGLEVWSYGNLQGIALSDSDKVTYDLNNGTNYKFALVGDSSDADLLTTHDAVDDILDFLWVRHGRDSYDGAGAVVRSYGHYGVGAVWTNWDGKRMFFGDGDGVTFTYMGASDVVAHEFGHALSDHEANLIYAGESGALEDAGADMLAASVHSYIDPLDWVFDIGEDCWLTAGNAFRFMSRPADGGAADHYSEYSGSNPPQTNAGIGDHWFFLLAHGGKHHDPAHRTGVYIKKIGSAAAYKIWYRALTTYMTSSTNFAGARAATAAACGDYYSASVCHEVAEAWYELGVGVAP